LFKLSNTFTSVTSSYGDGHLQLVDIIGLVGVVNSKSEGTIWFVFLLSFFISLFFFLHETIVYSSFYHTVSTDCGAHVRDESAPKKCKSFFDAD
jgi:hypothetical protein